MRHRNGRPVAATPALVGNPEGGGRAADRIYIRIGIVRINQFGRRPSLRHRLGIERPVHIPGHFSFADKKRRKGHIADRPFILAAERLVGGAAHTERAAGNRFHPERYSSAGNPLGEILESRHFGRSGERVAFCCGLRHPLHLSMFVVGIVMAHIKVAADTLQPEFLLIFLVIEVSGYPFVGQACREQLPVALLAGFVEDDLLCILELSLAFPIDLLGIFKEVRPDIFRSRTQFRKEIVRTAFRRQVALGATGGHTAFGIVMHREFPTFVGGFVHMTGHAVFIGRSLHVDPVQRNRNADPDSHAEQGEQNYFPSVFAGFLRLG